MDTNRQDRDMHTDDTRVDTDSSPIHGMIMWKDRYSPVTRFTLCDNRIGDFQMFICSLNDLEYLFIVYIVSGKNSVSINNLSGSEDINGGILCTICWEGGCTVGRTSVVC